MNETISNLKAVRQVRGQLLASWNLNHDKFTNVCAAEPTELNDIVLQAKLIQDLFHTLLTIGELVVFAEQLISAAEDEIYHSAGAAALAAV